MQQLRAKLKDMKEEGERAEGGASFPEVLAFEFLATNYVKRPISFPPAAL